MSLLQKLKSALGFDGTGSSDQESRHVDVTVEREPSVESEDAVKGTEIAASDTGTSETGHSDEPTVDTGEPAVEESESSVVERSDDENEPTVDDSEPMAQNSTASVTEISGIGPAYGQRLSDAGVETVSDLIRADVDELASEIDVSTVRIQRWIDAVNEH